MPTIKLKNKKTKKTGRLTEQVPQSNEKWL
jgi:hypothetical protein